MSSIETTPRAGGWGNLIAASGFMLLQFINAEGFYRLFKYWSTTYSYIQGRELTHHSVIAVLGLAAIISILMGHLRTGWVIGVIGHIVWVAVYWTWKGWSIGSDNFFHWLSVMQLAAFFGLPTLIVYVKRRYWKKKEIE